mmetsp:Transcript_4020/g.12497  ORF Transcript_4020/g.12497 Transcript_4020/m.12497 type:complete len:114 (+) Transcript_4020:750-1091(+)
MCGSQQRAARGEGEGAPSKRKRDKVVSAVARLDMSKGRGGNKKRAGCARKEEEERGETCGSIDRSSMEGAKDDGRKTKSFCVAHSSDENRAAILPHEGSESRRRSRRCRGRRV